MVLSLMLVVVFGLLASKLFEKLNLPGLLGMLVVGVILGPHGLNWLDASLLENAVDIRLIALVIILLRAGLGLEKSLLQRVGPLAIKMSVIPCVLEGFTVMVMAHWLLRLPLAEAGLLGFIVAAVSPAVIVPAMLQLKSEGWGMKRGVPVIILAGASVDDVFAITLFTVFLGFATQAEQSLFSHLLHLPLKIFGGILLGVVLGLGLAALFRRWSIPHLERVGVTVAGAFAALLLGEKLQLAGLLGVMTLGFLLQERVMRQAEQLEATLGRIWFFAQIFLFVLIGAEVDLTVAWQAGLLGVVIIGAGLMARSLGVFLALWRSELTFNERVFAALAYLPKATVQAAIGGIPLALGIASGATILAIAVLAVVITASLGAIAIQATAPRLLTQEAMVSKSR